MAEIKIHTETEALFHDLNKPSLHALSYALRHPDTWPEGFVWNYRQCNQCAMGLANRLWKQIPPGANNHNIGASRMARAFAIPFTAASRIFFGYGNWGPSKIRGYLWWKKVTIDHSRVTPEMVADQIDAYLEKAE